ncbi:hemolysin family protein [Deinococcus roseus]|uniref:Hemolysin n=1 Tax=Deinococcus roseus TaxID=392414 RepID=A0ABQ2D3E2_9DEIO|nr:hemolysin family protein [Deinococcus roseus]GGJ41006.1 hypothetical protein GCM10008938_28810 [Deinococcus roseus]
MNISDLLGLLSLFVLVILNGYFVASEFALVSVRRTRIEQLVDEGVRAAKDVKTALQQLDLYIAATQLGITMASLAIGFVAEPAIEHLLHPWLEKMEVSASSVKAISFGVAFAISTTLHIVFGELAPKSIALQLTEQTALAVTKPLMIFTTVFRPVIFSMNWLGNKIVSLLGLKPASGHHSLYSEEEIRMILDTSSEAGMFEEQEREFLENVFEFDAITVKAIMTHRTEIIAMPADAPLRELIEYRREHGYSRVPVFEGTLDNITGIIHTADTLLHLDHLDTLTLETIKRPVYFVPESMKVRDLFNSLKTQKTHMAIVVDEFGGTAGLVTLEDAIEELVGDIYDETDEEEDKIQILDNNTYMVDGGVHMNEIESLLEMEIDNSDESEYETVAGFLFSRLGHIPKVGESVRANNWIFEVMDANDRAIKQVSIYPHTEVQEEEA